MTNTVLEMAKMVAPSAWLRQGKRLTKRQRESIETAKAILQTIKKSA